VTIDVLSDNVLLEIFDFYKDDIAFYILNDLKTWTWKTLIQVCRRWRCVIFGSPRRLNLRIVCTGTTPTRTSLDIWPPFPINIYCQYTVDEKSVENIIAAVEHGHDRISRISIGFDDSALRKLTAAMQQPLPTLKRLCLSSYGASVLPGTFLGGSAPALDHLELFGISFPTFPKFILSSTHIRYLSILSIPHSGYISPIAMAACLAALPNLEGLSIGFSSHLSRPPQITLPRIRIVFPALIGLSFCGLSDYLEDFVAQIDTPLLNELDITFPMNIIYLIFELPQLRHFIRRSERFKQLDQAAMEFHDEGIWIGNANEFPCEFRLEVLCESPDWQLSSMVQILSQQLPLLSHVEQLEIFQDDLSGTEWMDGLDMDSLPWLDLFRYFIALQSLYVSAKLVVPISAALQELTEGRTMEVLPVLHGLFLEELEPSGPVPEGIQSFVAARQLSDHHVAVQKWNRF
jgi:hypothetical protein